MEHENSILYHPVNVLWHSAQHRFAWDIPDHVIMALLVLVISAILFPIAARNISRDNPGPLQQMLELTVEGTGAEQRQYKKELGRQAPADRALGSGGVGCHAATIYWNVMRWPSQTQQSRPKAALRRLPSNRYRQH